MKCNYCDSIMVTFTALSFCHSDCMLYKAVVTWLRKLLACYLWHTPIMNISMLYLPLMIETCGKIWPKLEACIIWGLSDLPFEWKIVFLEGSTEGIYLLGDFILNLACWSLGKPNSYILILVPISTEKNKNSCANKMLVKMQCTLLWDRYKSSSTT